MNTAVILAGGKSRRMGRDKLELLLDGRTLLESAVCRFGEEFEEVCISVADAAKYPDIKARRIEDIYQGAGPISGLHAALSTISAEGAFFVAADLPYSCPLAAKRLITLNGEHDACIIKLPDGRLEPLFGYYRKTLLPLCEKAILTGVFQIREMLFAANTRYLGPHELGDLWNEKLFLNLNYPEDYEKIQK